MSQYASPGKLLIAIVGRHKGEALVAAAKAAGARGGTISLGRSHEGHRILQALSLADVHQDMVFIVMGDEAGAVVAAITEAARNNPKKLAGLAVVLDVAGILRRAATWPTEGIPSMQENSASRSGFKLITVIVNHGYADDVMAVARKAGARGGTILNARGTGTEEDVKFFGISLVPEKEMLLIAAEEERVPAILDAVNTIPNLCQPGGGIVFFSDIENLIVLGKGE